MKKIMVLSSLVEKLPKLVDFIPKTEENSNNAKNINTMFFWNLIPDVLENYNKYCDRINKIYSINHIFIKND